MKTWSERLFDCAEVISVWLETRETGRKCFVLSRNWQGWLYLSKLNLHWSFLSILLYWKLRSPCSEVKIGWSLLFLPLHFSLSFSLCTTPLFSPTSNALQLLPLTSLHQPLSIYLSLHLSVSLFLSFSVLSHISNYAIWRLVCESQAS